MRIGYFWTNDGDPLNLANTNLCDTNMPSNKVSSSVNEFFLKLIKKNLIEFSKDKRRLGINGKLRQAKISVKEDGEISFLIDVSLQDYFLRDEGKVFFYGPTVITEKTENKIEIKGFSLDWFTSFLDENIVVRGFKLTQAAYTNKHQNLFQEKYKSLDEDTKHDNSFLLERTNNKKDLLYLCKLRSFHPNKFRLVLKTHKENQVQGIVPIRSILIDNKKIILKKLDSYFKMERSLFKIEHLLSDYELRLLENEGVVKFSGAIITKSNMNEFIEGWLSAVTPEITFLKGFVYVRGVNFVRAHFRSLIEGYIGSTEPLGILVNSLIGSERAKEFKKTNYGNYSPINGLVSYFGEIVTESNYKVHYIGTFQSKTGGVYIKVITGNIEEWLVYSGEWGYSHEYYAELGYSKNEIREHNMELKNKSIQARKNDYEDGLNWSRYNDQLDMDQQDPEFW